jgi:hypothetical protein
VVAAVTDQELVTKLAHQIGDLRWAVGELLRIIDRGETKLDDQDRWAIEKAREIRRAN